MPSGHELHRRGVLLQCTPAMHAVPCPKQVAECICRKIKTANHGVFSDVRC